MSDDIIDRLRCAYSKGDEPSCEVCTFCAARAEIERLRAENQMLNEALANNLPVANKRFAGRTMSDL